MLLCLLCEYLCPCVQKCVTVGDGEKGGGIAAALRQLLQDRVQSCALGVRAPQVAAPEL